MNKAQSLVELLLAIGLSAILLPALITGLVSSRSGKSQQTLRVEAISLIKETQEAVRSIRNRDWGNIAVNGTYHPVISGTMWASASGSLTEAGFTKSYAVSSVNRDVNGAIVTPPAGTVDNSTKKIDILVSWNQPYSSSVQTTFFLTRWRDNLPYTETTETQFDAGTLTGVTVRSSDPPQAADDGEIILGSGGNSNWCDPNLTSQSFDISGNGNTNGIWAVEGRAFLATGDDASGPDFVNVAISNPPQPTPPSISEEGSYDTNLKVNDVFGETVDGTSYAYLVTDDNLEEIVILNASNNPPTKISVLNISGSTNGNSIFVSNNILYTTFGTKLYSFNVSDRANPQALDSIDLPATGNGLFVVNGYVYVALNSTSSQLKIVDATTPSDLQDRGDIDVNDKEGVAVYVASSGDRAYLITNRSTSQPEFFIIDTSNKSSLSLVTGGTYDSGDTDPKGVSITPGNRAILVGWNGTEYQVINIDNENSPSSCGGAESDNVNGVSTVLESDGDAYSYIITTNTSSEFRIIVGGPGGSYASEGIFESQTFDPGYSTADNRFEANFSQPSNTTIQFQVALANLESGSCPSSYTFLGQDGTSSTWFPLTPTPGLTTYQAPFPLGSYAPNYSNPGQCFRYKVKLTTTDQNNTPVLYDFTINYSP
ncbi:hypothetical protein A2774_01825 [Candidatus Roizmanbacteria bacterium RIFCSPHIGHO2_01_FULL_39_12c]|uniref:LVIVD repeat protein n=1 Tax=Candidatus Roizmanbacteria bacterium RIFCSPHIGHO2_01_FULL_39_12c TaxID=1802031 RepID=A0A1F7GB13_9BACT|nr:MAG: hypothetical protein A2774_01825 [Candidatus Roizmanbacteria bacterium RIFCSPHIGHO2_01_FULL_39_12c]OGK46931.1 MAG: hypothetical protein A2963_05235 [Candidatus Roizmanbacteria bacterium RIFCSPLOWO2_01_FULL_40_13]